MIQFLPAVVSLVRPILGRVLLSLGFAVVTITGVGTAVSYGKDQLVAALQSNASNAGTVAAIQLAGLGGAWEGLGIVFGAMTFAVSMFTIRSAQSILGIGSPS